MLASLLPKSYSRSLKKNAVVAMLDGALTALEMAVLVEMCKQLPTDDRAALEQQLKGISVKHRENTGAGFFTYFSLGPDAARQIQADTKSAYVEARINGIDDALGFILWTKDGYVDFLEGYTLALDDTVGMDLSKLDFQLRSAPPINPVGS
jgi:hypothetical protein